MNTFNFWFQQGFDHIITTEALDHILYIVALCIPFSIKDWKKMLILVTAFTIGHSITLLLTALKIIDINTDWVEFLIPVTIAITALLNLFKTKQTIPKNTLLYLMTLFFGFIHGMAFGVSAISSFYTGTEALKLVFAFNVGIEVAQLLIVFLFIFLNSIIHKYKTAYFIYWQRFLSSIIFVYAVYLAIKYLP